MLFKVWLKQMKKIDHVIKKQGEYESALVKAEARHEVLEHKVSAIVKEVNALKTELEAKVKKETEEVKTFLWRR